MKTEIGRIPTAPTMPAPVGLHPILTKVCQSSSRPPKIDLYALKTTQESRTRQSTTTPRHPPVVVIAPLGRNDEMNDEDIRNYDDTLLSKERGIKAATAVVNMIIVLAIAVGILFPFWMILRRPGDMALFGNFVDDIYRVIGWLIVLALLVKLNRNHLRHIASIKLYRK